jgi:glycosyltransferase involved in cell wall biosynthesis
VPNFVDSARLQPLRRRTAVLHEGPLRVVIAAKLYPAKGVEAFLDVLASRHETALQVEVAGDGGDEAHLRQRFPSVYFHGLLSSHDTLRLTAAADAVVVPSICEEACPSTVLEALMLGKTVFALRLGGTPELAAFQSGPDQLRLLDSMEALVDALLAFRPRSDYPFAPQTPVSVADTAGRLLALYRLPPGAVFA